MSKHLFRLTIGHEGGTLLANAAVNISNFKPYNTNHEDQNITKVEARINVGGWSPMVYSTLNGGTWAVNIPVQSASNNTNVNISVEIRINEDPLQQWTIGESVCYAWENAPRSFKLDSLEIPLEGVDEIAMPSQIEITDAGCIVGTSSRGATSDYRCFPLEFELNGNAVWLDADSLVNLEFGSKIKTFTDGQFATPTEDFGIRRQTIGSNGSLIIAPLTNILTFFAEAAENPDFLLRGTVTNPSTAGSSDGAIDLVVTGGVGPFTYLWGDAITTQDRTGIAAGIYAVEVTDTGNANSKKSINFGVVDPAVVAPGSAGLFRETFASCSPLTAIRFKNYEGVIDGASILKTPDNTNYCENPPDEFNARPYYEVLNIADAIKLQFKSDHEANTLQLFDSQGVFQKGLQLVTVVNNIDDYTVQTGYVRDHGGGQLRIYNSLNEGHPVSTNVGDFVQLESGVGTYDGEYSILSIDWDVNSLKYYLVVAGTYSINENQNISYLNNRRYNLLEATISASADLGLGDWRLKFVGGDPSAESSQLISEQIRVQSFTPNTLLVTAKNIDTAFDVDWATGIDVQIRVAGFIFASIPARDASVHRNSNDVPEMLNSYIRRMHDIRMFELPWFGVERLSLAFSCDVFKINGIEYLVEELPEPEMQDRTTLARITVLAEHKGWLIDQNAHDAGEISIDNTEVIGGEGGEVLGV